MRARSVFALVFLRRLDVCGKWRAAAAHVEKVIYCQGFGTLLAMQG